ncbi:MAG: hypothetical protein P9M03_05170 [Candidatus Theseobacter exili]|nr:hypothetical protein [Candidatus Theseobacter exili]
MRKTVFVLLVIFAVAFFTAGTAEAGEREWATAGKILTGVVGASVVADAVYGYPRGGYYYPRYYAPAPAPVYGPYYRPYRNYSPYRPYYRPYYRRYRPRRSYYDHGVVCY